MVYFKTNFVHGSSQRDDIVQAPHPVQPKDAQQGRDISPKYMSPFLET